MKLSLQDKSVLYHELAKLTASGFGFDKSADLLLQQVPNRAIAAFAQETIRRLRQGQTIASAVDQPSMGIVELDHLVIQAAEHGGVLETGFAYLRDHYQALLLSRRTIFAKLLYPALLLHLAAFLPAIPSLLLGTSTLAELRQSFALLFAIYGLSAFLWWLGKRLFHLAGRSVPADRLLSLLPLFGKARRLASLQRFAAVFRISLLAAQRPSEALTAAGAASGSAILLRAAQTLSQTAQEGSALATVLPQISDLPAGFRRSLATAEISGTLPQDLQSWSSSFARDLETHLIRVGTLLPFLATLLVASFVAWRLFSLWFGVLNSEVKSLEGLW